MADYPCDLHLARYKGPSTRLYVNAFREDQELRLKGSLCEACFDEALREFAARLLHELEDGGWDPPEDGTEPAALWKPSGGPRNGRWPAGRR